MGRRYLGLCGSALVIIGMTIVGVAGRMDVAIAGSAITGVGAGFAELVGAAGVAELAPVKSRGKYLAITLLMLLPFGAITPVGRILLKSALIFSSVILRFLDVEMGCLDFSYPGQY